MWDPVTAKTAEEPMDADQERTSLGYSFPKINETLGQMLILEDLNAQVTVWHW